MNNRVKSLKVKNEVINLINKEFNIKFSYSFNDLYKVKDNNVVRRLKGYFYRLEDSKNVYVFEKKEFNDLVVKIDNFLNDLKFEGFKIRLKKKEIVCLKRERDFSNSILNLKEYKEMREYNMNELILSIRFEDI
jgi:hypothetical protein